MKTAGGLGVTETDTVCIRVQRSRRLSGLVSSLLMVGKYREEETPLNGYLAVTLLGFSFFSSQLPSAS